MTQQWRNSSAVFHTRAEEYDSWFNDSLLFDIEAAAIRGLPTPPAQPALEIGVGPGRFAKELGLGFGIDPAFAPLELSRDRGIVVCQAIGEALPFRNSSFASISLFFTFCFLQNPENVLQEIGRVLQKDGQLTLGFVPLTGDWGKNLQEKKEAGHPFYKHARFFTISEIKGLLEKQNFSITAVVSSLFQAPGEISKMEKPQTGADDTAGFVVFSATPNKH